jgi:hypothetical protein
MLPKSILLLPILWSAVAEAQSTGTFTTTGNMTTARFGSTATLLPNGKVLIAGGSQLTPGALPSTLYLASAELYDPSIGAFIPTGEMTTARSGHSATLLPDGKVLIAGGFSTNNKYLASGELYDPSTGTFTATGDMVIRGSATQANVNTATLLAAGKVLIAHITAAELYDPVTGTFSATGDQLEPTGDQKATLLADGRVLLATSCCIAGQLYYPPRGTFSLTGATTRVYEDGFTAAPLMNGKVLLAGGYAEEAGVLTAGAELYDPSIGTFAPTGDMTTGRSYHTATPLGDGTVLIAAGSQGISFGFFAGASAELYDPATGTFVRTGNMITGRYNPTATLLLDGTALIAGGSTLSGTYDGTLASAELYHPLVPAPAPVLFSLSGDGKGQGAIWHAATGQVASANNPAMAGEALSLFTTSFVDGGVIPPQVPIGGRLAEILYFGNAPGYPGYYQVNFRVPDGVASGPAVPVRITYFSRPSNQVTIGVQ